MASSEIFVGQTPLETEASQVKGDFVKRDGQTFYRIENVDQMRPFFMSLVSHSDHWLFVASSGGISAGREDENSALFPYYTDDKITNGRANTGPLTIVLVKKEGKQYLWEPFSEMYPGAYELTRSLYKSTVGNHLIFEEINHDLELTFEYSWQFSERFGFVRKCKATNNRAGEVELRVLDGIQNILPYGISSGLQNVRSNLANAYKRCELHTSSGIGMFSLSSMIVDKAEPSEALGATVVWTYGIVPDTTLLSTLQLAAFRNGREIHTENDIKAEPGAYLVATSLNMSADESRSWYIVSDVNQDLADIAEVKHLIQNEENLSQVLEQDIDSGTRELRALVAQSDGLQVTGDPMSSTRHYSNVLFNIMRGGTFEDAYVVRRDDLLDYFMIANKPMTEAHAPFFDGLPETFSYQHLIEHASSHQDPDLIRLAYEYLPLSFSRRHGDPSRPWNKFRIDGKNDEGRRNKYYAGNWRDIFQNWEALGLSFPHFIPSMITKFVDASTIDGYNPYRITRQGIDWEVIEPDDPWSYIGYWGDHQIIYLQKLLEILKAHQPGKLKELLNQGHFVYANVPYRIRAYNAIVADPQDTIDFAHDVEQEVERLVSEIGSDGKLVYAQGKLLRVNLVEKLMLTLLTKVSNFIPDAGIWMNTQRPEWNDANNALVGNGVSMVTLCYMNRYVKFLQNVFADQSEYSLTTPLSALFNEIHITLRDYLETLEAGFSDESRRTFIDRLGSSGDRYRFSVYGHPIADTEKVSSVDIHGFLELCQQYFEATIHSNKREDGLYHAYNLAHFSQGVVAIDRLYEMLEGQVAVLSADVLNTEQAAQLLDDLKASPVYREDQYSYMLYPNRELPGFLQKNTIPNGFINTSKLIAQMQLDDEQGIVLKDINGDYHFNRDFHNAGDLKAALDRLREKYPDLIETEAQDFLTVFEEMFNHSAFTGRSGTFFGYEGLGSIYWHMVSKLLLAVQENIEHASGESVARGKLIDHYYEIRAGIGVHKTPDLYGSFPFDPYSHTPWSKGAQQPGMTGQVKEDIINRWAEFGVHISDGAIRLNPQFLNPIEFLQEGDQFDYVSIDGEDASMSLEPGELAFTYCQVPIKYHKSSEQSIEVHYASGEILEVQGDLLPQSVSNEIFGRTGLISSIVVRSDFGQ